jgi:hypothetical protein
LHDLNGRIIKTYIIEAGANSLNLTDIKPGVYYATFAADSWQMTQKMVLNPE